MPELNLNIGSKLGLVRSVNLAHTANVISPPNAYEDKVPELIYLMEL